MPIAKAFRLIASDFVRGPTRLNLALAPELAFYAKNDERVYLVPPQDMEAYATLLVAAGETVYRETDQEFVEMMRAPQAALSLA